MAGIILVTGATGRQGGAVARRLLAEGFAVRAMTRKPDGHAAVALAKAGAEIVAADYDDPPSLDRALVGVSGVYAMQTPYEAGIEREECHGVRLAEAAADAGVRHFVYSSVASADLPTGVAHFESKGRIERRVMALNFPHTTILRPTFFMEMLLAPGNLRSLARGKIELSLAPDTRVAMIAVDDIARMAIAALRHPDRWSGQAVTLAGDQPNFVEVAAAWGQALGREITYIPVNEDAIDPDTRPKIATQRWLESTGWTINLAALRASYPFNPLTIGQWAAENANRLRGASAAA